MVLHLSEGSLLSLLSLLVLLLLLLLVLLPLLRRRVEMEELTDEAGVE